MAGLYARRRVILPGVDFLISVQSFCKAVMEHNIDESLMKFGVAAFDIIFGGVILSGEKAQELEPEQELDLLSHIFIGKMTARVYLNKDNPGASDGELKCGVIAAILGGNAAIECTLPHRADPKKRISVLPERKPDTSPIKRLRQFFELFRRWYSPNLEENYETLEDDEFEREMLQAERKYVEAKYLFVLRQREEQEADELMQYRQEERLTLQAIGEIMVFLDNLRLRPTFNLFHGGGIARESVTLEDLELTVGRKSFAKQEASIRPVLQEKTLTTKQLGRSR